MSESTEQQALIYWYRMQYPDRMIFAIPNGEWLHGNKLQRIKQMQKAKREGLLPGTSDLFIPEPVWQGAGGEYYHGLFIEMKDVGATQCKVSPEQKQFIEDMRKRGYAAHWAAGFDVAKPIIEDYMRGAI